MIKKLFFLLLLSFGLIVPSSKELTKSRIESVLAKLPSSTVVGILIYNPLTQDTIYASNQGLPMIPASNTKLFTSATALSIMGGDYSLSTKLMTSDNNLSDGIINGNLYIKGYGNPLFSQEDITSMAAELSNLGIIRITGSVIGDDTYFDDIYTRDDWIKDEVANVKLSPISAIVVDRNRTITYRKVKNRTRSYVVNVKDPPLYAAEKLKEKLILAGVRVENGHSKGESPSSAIVITERKIPLREVLDLVNKNSDNFLAECLFKTIGAAATGEQGNSFYSTQAILSFIEDNGIFARGTAVVDGSGISRFNQITPGAIVGLLEKMYFDLKYFDDYYNSFAIAGVDGTLKRRMKGTNAESNFRGKTGTLNGVSSLSGYLTTAGGDDLIVSIIMEFKKGGHYVHRDAQDAIVAALSNMD